MKRVMRICLLAGLYGLLLAPMVWAQTVSLSGTVTDADDGQSLPGASVLIAGTAQGTATDFDGNYSITGLDPGTYTIVFSFIGYQNQEIDEAFDVRYHLRYVDVLFERAGLGD